MDPGKPSIPVLKKIASGYARLGASLALWIGAALVAVAVSAAVVWPLWILASSRRDAYNAVFLSVSAAAIAALAFFSVKRRLASGTSPSRILRGLLSFAGLAAAWIALLLSGYLFLAFVSRGFILGAVPAFLVSFSLAGYLFFGHKRSG